jgi:hypothetical protein
MVDDQLERLIRIINIIILFIGKTLTIMIIIAAFVESALPLV